MGAGPSGRRGGTEVGACFLTPSVVIPIKPLSLGGAVRVGAQLLVVNYAEVESMWVGETPKNVAAVFRMAVEQNAVLFFDEADAIATRRARTRPGPAWSTTSSACTNSCGSASWWSPSRGSRSTRVLGTPRSRLGFGCGTASRPVLGFGGEVRNKWEPEIISVIHRRDQNLDVWKGNAV